MRAADAVVATGRAAVEALMAGRRVVAAKSLRDRRGQLGPAITPTTFDAAAADNFSWRTGDPADAGEVWAELEALSAADVTAVRDRARAQLSAESLLERELGIIVGLDAGPTDQARFARLRRELEGGLLRGRRPPRPLMLADRAAVKLRPKTPLRW
jgi:hypothetical protein